MTEKWNLIDVLFIEHMYTLLQKWLGWEKIRLQLNLSRIWGYGTVDDIDLLFIPHVVLN